jgi:hypothetical protein
VRLVEFLILLLDAHAQALQRLAALFGEEGLVELLEEAGDRAELDPGGPEFDLKASWFEPPKPGDPSHPYAELESAVSEIRLPEHLVFHVWAYPHYRHYIESALELNMRIPAELGSILADEAVADADRWVKSLGLAPTLSAQAEKIARPPWVQFRAAALKRIGKRPVGAI